MERVLIAAASDKSAASLKDFISSNQAPEHITTVFSGNEARRSLLENDFELVVINSPLPDEFGHELALTAARQSNAGVILLVKAEVSDSVSARVEEDGVFVVPKPINKPIFFQAMRLVNASRKRIFGLQKENLKLLQKIEDIRIVDRAKCIMIEVLNMTEAQAHSYIEKQAMDMRVTKREIALGILKTYEN